MCEWLEQGRWSADEVKVREDTHKKRGDHVNLMSRLSPTLVLPRLPRLSVSSEEASLIFKYQQSGWREVTG